MPNYMLRRKVRISRIALSLRGARAAAEHGVRRLEPRGRSGVR